MTTERKTAREHFEDWWNHNPMSSAPGWSDEAKWRDDDHNRIKALEELIARAVELLLDGGGS